MSQLDLLPAVTFRGLVLQLVGSLSHERRIDSSLARFVLHWHAPMVV